MVGTWNHADRQTDRTAVVSISNEDRGQRMRGWNWSWLMSVTIHRRQQWHVPHLWGWLHNSESIKHHCSFVTLYFYECSNPIKTLACWMVGNMPLRPRRSVPTEHQQEQGQETMPETSETLRQNKLCLTSWLSQVLWHRDIKVTELHAGCSEV